MRVSTASVLPLFLVAATCVSATTAVAQRAGGIEPVRSPQARALMARWEGENRRCVAGGGAAVPCARRQITARKLRGLRWCYGKLDIVGALYDWHRCRPGE